MKQKTIRPVQKINRQTDVNYGLITAIILNETRIWKLCHHRRLDRMQDRGERRQT